MKISKADFVKSAVRPDQYPLPIFPEIAFVGRSNVGKSSLINALTNRKNLAKTSNTPGRTQLINFFLINESVSFVDLPGYGFAKVPLSVKKDWGRMIEIYLKERPSLVLVVMILDIRRDPSPDDLSLIDWLSLYRIPCLFILTKADKFSNNQCLARRKSIEKALGRAAQSHMILFSAKTRKGVDDVLMFIDRHLAAVTNACD